MTRTLSTAAAILLASAAAAQTAVVVPDNPTSLPEGVTSYPWDQVGQQCRVMYLHAAQSFTNQGITFPIDIQSIANQSTSVVAGAATYPNVQVEMSTGAPGAYAAYSMASFAANHGLDRMGVFAGTVATSAPDPSGYFVTVPVNPPFPYDPAAGDLVVDITQNGLAATGTGTRATGPLGLSGLGSRIYHPSSATATAPLAQNAGYAIRTRILYTPSTGLTPAFAASVTSGAGPLTVQFTDASTTDDPGGILSWAWDFDGNGTIDSTQQNPTFSYTACGDYDVELQVTDGLNGTVTLRKVGLLAVDPLTANFKTTALGGSSVQFTDTSAFAPTSWSWDLDGDGSPDSTAQNPSFSYPARGRYTVSLTTTNACRSATITKIVSTYSSLETVFGGGNGLSDAGAAALMDLRVLNPSGIVITGMDVSSFAAAASGTVELRVTNGGYAGATLDPAAWRLVATGTAALTGGAGSRDYVALPDVYLPPGRYGLAVSTSAGLSYTDGVTATTSFGNGDATLVLGAAQQTRFSSAPFSPRVWNGALYYDAFDVGGYGFLGTGCPGSAGTSAITAVPGTGPRIGSTLQLDVTGMPPAGGVAVLVLGFSTTSWNGTPLPVGLAPFGMPGCFGRIEPFDTFLLLNNAGSAQWSLPIPVVSAYIGDVFYNQVLVLDPAAGNPLGAVMSDAAGGRVGS